MLSLCQPQPAPIDTSVDINSQTSLPSLAVKRRRAAKACLSCRARKVRCNAVQKFPSPCSNCQFDDTECTMPRKDQPRLSPPRRDRNWSPHDEQQPNRAQPPYNHIKTPTATYDDHTQTITMTGLPWLAADTVALEDEAAPTTQIDSRLDGDGISTDEHGNVPPSVSDVIETSVTEPDGPGAHDYARSLSLPDLNLMDFFVGYTPDSIQAYAQALDDSQRYNDAGNNSAHHANPSISTWAPDDYTVVPTTADIPDKDMTRPGIDHSPKQALNHMPNRSLAMPPETMGDGVCMCIPPCHQTNLRWVACWCMRQVDQGARSKVHAAKALVLPPVDVIHALLENYFLYANAQNPCVNEHDMYILLHGESALNDQHNHDPKPISMALLNSLMFAASGFATVKQAHAAGFSDLSQMRIAFYERAKTLYEVRCETSSMARLEICLLLCSYRPCNSLSKTPNLEAFSWLVEAQNILMKLDVRRFVAQRSLTSEEKHWKILYGCYFLRTCTLLTGARSMGATIELPTVGLELTLDDLEGLECTWLVDGATKRRVAELFLAIYALSLIAMPFGQLLKRYNADMLQSSFVTDPNGRSLMAELQDFESRLTGWRSKYEDLLQETSWPAVPTNSDVCLCAVRSSVRLSYEYSLCLLHQLNLIFKRPLVSAWTAMMMQTSRDVIQESASATVAILEGLIKRDVLRFVSDTIIPFVLVPLTISTVSLKSSGSNAAIVRTLTTCYTTLGVFAERYEIVDLYLKLSEMCTALTHDRMLQEQIPYTSDLVGLKRGISFMLPDNNAPPTILLPPTELYSLVLRSLEYFFVHGNTEHPVFLK